MISWDPQAFYIGGSWVASASDATEFVINPATAQSVETIAAGSVEDAERAIFAARKAFDDGSWSELSIRERSRYMGAFRDALVALEREVTELSIAEAGITRRAVEQSILPISLGHLDFAIEECSRDLIEPLPLVPVRRPDGGSHMGAGMVVRDPVGVVAAIVPFNSPYQVSVAKVGHALATGNTVVLKASPLTPFGSLILGRAAEIAGFPAGVLNVINGGADVGQRLVESTRVDMVSFTGSDGVGSAIMAQAAPSLKKLVLELGGKSAQIVLEDANLDSAAIVGTANFTSYAGQGCSLRTRHFVHEKVLEPYLERLRVAVDSVQVGDPGLVSTDMGPLISQHQRERVEGYVSAAISRGARAIAGGRRPAKYARGYFYEPTVLTGVSNADPVAQEEIFGPVVVVIPFRTDEEAVVLTNQSEYGLGGALWSEDAERAVRVARRMRTGQVHINGGPGMQTAVAPFGGIKRSGLGREYGREGLFEYTEVKYIGFATR